MPRYCGDFTEVLHAVQVGMDRLKFELISECAVRLGVTPAKRLGWVLEASGVPRSKLVGLAELPIKGYRKLDPIGLWKGSCNSRWPGNLPGMVGA